LLDKTLFVAAYITNFLVFLPSGNLT